MKTRTINTYSINELSPESKKKGIDNVFKKYIKYDIIDRNHIYMMDEIIKDNNTDFLITEIHYDLENNWICFGYSDISEELKTIFWENIPIRFSNIITKEKISISFSSKIDRYYKPIYSIEIDTPHPNIQEYLENTLKRFVNYHYKRNCKNILSQLKEEYEFRQSDEYVICFAENNEIEFLENGNIYLS